MISSYILGALGGVIATIIIIGGLAIIINKKLDKNEKKNEHLKID